jgi:hypothetical protein
MQSSEPGGARGAFWPALPEEFAWIWSFAGKARSIRVCLNANSTPGWLVLPLEFAASLRCASNGEYILYAIKKTDAERVISFEPDQTLLTKLQRNLQLNGLEADPGLELYAKYLSDKEGSDSVDASFLADRILTPCLIEMDIDGEETAVLHAAVKGFLQNRVPGGLSRHNQKRLRPNGYPS